VKVADMNRWEGLTRKSYCFEYIGASSTENLEFLTLSNDDLRKIEKSLEK